MYSDATFSNPPSSSPSRPAAAAGSRSFSQSVTSPTRVKLIYGLCMASAVPAGEWRDARSEADGRAAVGGGGAGAGQHDMAFRSLRPGESRRPRRKDITPPLPNTSQR